jgi:myo-inositol 2-dehydrogenase/D-chiro-inositol 1-dehydrogenase
MSRKVKIGLIGLGRIGQIHLSNMLYHIPQAEVVIASDMNPETHAFALSLGVPTVTNDAMEVINHPEVEAVIICSPTPSHVPFTVAAANNKKHVFCEKPLDVTLESIHEAEWAVERNGVKLMLGFNRRFDTNFRNIQRRVEKGKIGEPHLLRITSRDPAPPPVEYLKISGGIFLDMSIHDFDMARYIVDSEVEEVYVKGDALIYPEITSFGDIDTAVIVLTFQNGTIGVIDNSRQAVYGYDQRLEIFGSKGMMKAENNTEDNVQAYTTAGEESSLPLHFFLERYEQAYRSCLSTFIECILEDKPSPVNGHDGLMATAIGIAAKKSLVEGRPVKMSEILTKTMVS